MKLVLLLIVSLLLAQAQTPPAAKRPPAPKAKPAAAKPSVAKPAAKAFPIRSLAVEGANQLPADGILKAAGLRVGQPAEKELFEAARQNLADTGLFEKVGYRYAPTSDNTGFDATIIVTEIDQLLPFRYEDLEAKPADLTKALREADPLYADRLSGTPLALKRYTAILSGAAKTPVAAKVVADGPGQLAIVFRPDRNDPTISQVSFKGNEVLPTALLQTTINGVAMGAVFKEDRMREYLDNAIRPLYEARGRVAVAFQKITAAPAADNKGLDVTVEIAEGPSYELDQINVVGDGDLRQFSRVLQIASGDLANMDAVREGMQRIGTELRKQGFLKNNVKLERKLAPAKKEGDKNLLHLTITCEAGPQYKFRSLTIQGLDILNEPQLRKMWSMEPGSPYNGDYPDYFLKRIREDALFDDLGATRAIVKLDDAALQSDVTLVFGKAAPAAKKKRPF